MSGEGLQFDQSQLGLYRNTGQVTVDPNRIITYARSIGDTTPLHTDERAAQEAGYRSVVAPFGFCNVLANDTDRPDPHLQVSGLRSMLARWLSASVISRAATL